MKLAAIRPWLQRNPWARWLGSAVLLGAVVLVLPRRHVWEGLRSLQVGVVLATLPLFLAIHAIGALKWHMLVNRAGSRISARDSLQCYFAGLFGNLFLPSVVGGDAIMLTVALKKTEKPAGVVIGSLLNRVLDLAALLILTGVAAALLPATQLARDQRAFGRVLMTAMGCALLLGAAAGALKLAWSLEMVQRLVRKHRATLELLRRPGLIVMPLAMSLLIQFGLLALSYWITLAGGLRVSPVAWVFAWPLAKLVSMLPVGIGGIGTREIALSALLAPFGAPAASVVATAVAWDAVMVSGSLCAGVIWKALASAGKPAAIAISRS